MKVAFFSSEVFPFAKTGGLGDVCGSLPLALEQSGIEISIVMPGYRCVGQSGQPIEQLTERVSRATVGSNINVYFIDHAFFFDRPGLYGDGSVDYPDNLERFSFFCDQALLLLKQIDFQPSVIHCHDWQTALIPVFLKEKYSGDEFYSETKSVLTIHNLAFQGLFPKGEFAKLGLDDRLFSIEGFEYYDQVNFLKAGIIYSDAVTTVSAQYANEIQTKEFGCGLEDVIHSRGDQVNGILNGLDYRIWDPAVDENIARKYSAKDFNDAKLVNKSHLQKELGLKVSNDAPLFGFIGRLSHQKGIDLILDHIDALVQMGVQIAFLGMGDKQYQGALDQKALQYSENIALCPDFNEPLGHRVYAGSDFFLMPSRFEPCGLSQMISLCYGTIPVVFRTGGLVDTVKPYGLFAKNGNGLMFSRYDQTGFLKVIKKAVKIFQLKAQLKHLRQNAFRSRFTWEKSARQYREIYRCA
jgi:starch synthase